MGTKRNPQRRASGRVPFLASRGRAALAFRARTVADLARETGTSYPRLYLLLNREGDRDRRRCERSFRDALASALKLDPEWLGGLKDELAWVLAPDCSLITSSPERPPRGWHLAFEDLIGRDEAAVPNPLLQLRFNGLLDRTHHSLMRDLRAAHDSSEVARAAYNEYGSFGMTLVATRVMATVAEPVLSRRPTPKEVAISLSAAVEMWQAQLDPWFTNSASPNWNRLYEEVVRCMPNSHTKAIFQLMRADSEFLPALMKMTTNADRSLGRA